MKRLLGSILLLSIILLLNTGCVDKLYTVFVDDRNVKTIASDTAIEYKILKKLGEGKTSDLVDISVTSYRSDVFLVGEYDNIEQKNRFLTAARQVEGVKSVDSYLVKSDKNHPCGTTKNIKITAKVKTNLIGDKTIWSTNIHISTIKCQVVLWGTVGTKEEISKSIQHAEEVEGVLSVKSFLKSL